MLPLRLSQKLTVGTIHCSKILPTIIVWFNKRRPLPHATHQLEILARYLVFLGNTQLLLSCPSVLNRHQKKYTFILMNR